MTKFRILEVRQKVQEDTKTQQVGKKTADIVQSLANIGRMFGVKTEFLTTMTNLVSNVLGLFKGLGGRTDEQKKVISVLLNNTASVDMVLRKSQGIAGPTPIVTKTALTPEQVQIQNNLITSFNSLNPKTWSKVPTEEQIKQATQQAIINKPEIVDDKILFQDSYDILRELIKTPETGGGK